MQLPVKNILEKIKIQESLGMYIILIVPRVHRYGKGRINIVRN